MPLALPQVDEKTFKKLSKQLHRALEERASGALGVNLNQLREALAQALGHGSVHGARQGWDKLPAQSAALEPIASLSPDPDKVSLSPVPQPDPPALWTAAFAALDEGVDAFVVWAVAHPAAFWGLRWKMPGETTTAQPVDLAEVLLGNSGARGWDALTATLAALDRAPMPQWWENWCDHVLVGNRRYAHPIPAERWLEVGQWFGQRLSSADAQIALAKTYWKWGRSVYDYENAGVLPQTDPRASLYLEISRRDDLSVPIEHLPAGVWLAALGQWDLAFDQIERERQAFSWHGMEDVALVSVVFRQGDVVALSRLLETYPWMAEVALRQVDEATPQPLAHEVFDRVLGPDGKEAPKAWDEREKLLALLIKTKSWKHLNILGLEINRQTSESVLDLAGGKRDQERARRNWLGDWVAKGLRQSLDPEVLDRVGAALMRADEKHRNRVLSSTVSALWEQWSDSLQTHPDHPGTLNRDPKSERRLLLASPEGLAMTVHLDWVHRQGWKPKRDDVAWTVWIHATAFDLRWWPKAVEMGAPAKGVLLPRPELPKRKPEMFPRPLGLLAAGMWENLITWDDVSEWVEAGVEPTPEDHVFLVEKLLRDTVDNEDTDEDNDALWRAWLEDFGIPEATWKQHFGAVQNLRQLVAWQRLAGGHPQAQHVAQWYAQGLDEATPMLDHALAHGGVDLAATWGEQREGIFHRLAHWASVLHQESDIQDSYARGVFDLVARGASVTQKNAAGHAALDVCRENLRIWAGARIPPFIDALTLAEAQEHNRSLEEG